MVDMFNKKILIFQDFPRFSKILENTYKDLFDIVNGVRIL